MGVLPPGQGGALFFSPQILFCVTIDPVQDFKTIAQTLLRKKVTLGEKKQTPLIGVYRRLHCWCTQTSRTISEGESLKLLNLQTLIRFLKTFLLSL